MSTYNLINLDLMVVKIGKLCEARGFHLVYVTMVTWEDLVLGTVDIRTITPGFQHVNGNLILV